MALAAGDIAFVGFNSDTGTNGKSFAFVALAALAAGEVIHFTDNGWLATNALRTGEGFLSWTAPAGGIAAGTVVTISTGEVTAISASIGAVTEPADVNFSTAGDQIIAFQGAVTNSTTFTVGTLLAALNDEGSAVWQSDATSTNTSALPTGLTNGTNAVALTELDNYIYSGPTTPADKATWLTRINTAANWTGSDTTPFSFSSLSITVTGGGDTTPPIITSITPSVPTIVDGTATFSLAILFNEAMDTTAGATPVITFPTAGEDPTSVITSTGGSWSGNTYTATFSVADGGVDLADIDVRVAAAKDAAGNTMLAATTADVFSISQLNPTLQSSTPADDAVSVSVSNDITVTFSETITIANLAGIELRKVSDDSVVTAAVSAAGSVLTIDPAASLDPGTAYYVSIAANAITDASGNGFAGLLNNAALNFTTLALGSPTITAVLNAPAAQAEGSTGQAAYSYTITWSDIPADTTVNYTLAGGGANPATVGGPGSDLNTVGGTFNITAGSGSIVLSGIAALGDTDVETDEQFQLTIDPVAGVTINQAGLATITNDDTPASIAIDSVQITEGDSGTQIMTFTVTRTGGNAPFSVDFATSSGTATSGADFEAASGTLNFLATDTSKTISVTINGDTAVEGNEAFSLTLSNPTNGTTISQAVGTGTIANDDFTKIYTIQGSGAASALVGQTVTIRAVVTGDFQNGDADTGRNLNGFTVQELVGDGNAATSDGIFIFQGSASPSTPNVNVGDIVTITGVVAEFNGETQLTATGAGAVTVTQAGALTQTQVNDLAATLNLPSAGTVANSQNIVIPDLEAYEGMLVKLPQTLTVSETFNLDRFGVFEVTQGGQAYQYTQLNTPDVAGNTAYTAAVAARTLTVDDGLWTQNPDITVGGTPLTSSSTFGNGDTVSNLTGVIRFSNPIGSTATTGATGETNYRLMATEAFTVTDANPRDATAPAVGGNLKIASFNVLNFFTTMNTVTTTNETNPIDDMWLGLDSRGANNNTEFLRQQDKLIGTLVTMNADVVTLIELENDFRAAGNTNASVAPGANGLTAIQFIVNGLNARLGAGTYDWVRPGSDALGGDAISVGMIYKTATVQVAPGTVVARLVDEDEAGGTEPDATTTDLADLGLTGLLANTPGLGIFEGGSTSRVPLATTFQEIRRDVHGRRQSLQVQVAGLAGGGGRSGYGRRRGPVEPAARRGRDGRGGLDQHESHRRRRRTLRPRRRPQRLRHGAAAAVPAGSGLHQPCHPVRRSVGLFLCLRRAYRHAGLRPGLGGLRGILHRRGRLAHQFR
jgi:predicted extracellular nuclease/methionine-rich copper-binding protein CopC